MITAPGVLYRLGAFFGAHTAAYLLFVLSWVVLGRAAFTGGVDAGDLLGWAALLAAAVPFQLLATRLQSALAITLGRLLRRRLLLGALNLETEEVRGRGVGRLLGQVLDAEAVETLAVGGGLLGLVAGVELVLAAVALGIGPGALLTIVLLTWAAGTVLLAGRYLRARRRWADTRLRGTDDLVEKLLGHRTRLAQQPPRHWHDGEAEALADYDIRGKAMDRRLAILVAVCPRGWLVVGVLGLWASAASGATPGQLAVGAGGVLLAGAALRTLTTGLAQLADAASAWVNVRPLFDSAARHHDRPHTSATPVPDVPLITADNVAFGYPGRPEPALANTSVLFRAGERVLIDGHSGGGKSTLVSLLAGLRTPTGGTLRLHGRTHGEIGTTHWRRRIAAAPQFHENHLMLGSLAFNLLLGRGWPATPEDLAAARRTCERLGLGPLLDRMPSGLHQIVGETGWQLSHGERSLVYLARALLQSADMIILDETFGTLDPVTQHQALTAASEIAPTLLVVHHQ